MQKKMTMAIESIIIKLQLEAAFGFGSAFKSEIFNDIDLLFITSAPVNRLASQHRSLSGELSKISFSLNMPIDFMLLTETEFSERLLREHDSLVPLS